mgnify:CR=1 FL=1
MKRDYSFFVKDILDAITKIEEFTNGMGPDEFASDDKTVSAVVRKIEIIGEAAKNMPEEIKKRHNDVEWGKVAKMRDKLIHGYFETDSVVVWKTIREDLPALKERIKKIINFDIKSDEKGRSEHTTEKRD